MTTKRFPNWNPVIGERALVPGGPANAQYVAELTADDVKAINSGHRGYTPLKLVILCDPDDPRLHDGLIDTIVYNERRSLWEGDMVAAKNPGVMLRAAKRYYAVGNNNFRLDVPGKLGAATP